MKLFWMTILGLTISLFAIACGEDEEPFVPTEEDIEWPEYTFTAELEPTVAGVPDREQWDSAEFPLEVTGEDNDDQSILYSLSLGHHWLVENQLEDGNYLFDYDASTGESEGSNSALQQWATAWSQVLLYRFVERESFLLAAYKVAKIYESSLSFDTLEDDTSIASVSGRLNRTAFYFFLVVELESVMDNGEFDEEIEAMANYFESQIDADGCISTSRAATSCADQHNVFAVGQGLVAFERLWRHTGDDKWLDYIERAANYYYDFYDGATSGFEFAFFWGAWANPSMITMLIERPDDKLEEWIFGQADYQVGDQYTPGDPEEFVGGFKKRAEKIPTWSAVSQVEGIIDAYRLAEARGDEERMLRYRASGILAARYLMSLQYRADNIDRWNLAEPQRAIGAYHFSNDGDSHPTISMHYVRTDYMDHMAVTLLKTLSYLDLPETYPGVGFATRN